MSSVRGSPNAFATRISNSTLIPLHWMHTSLGDPCSFHPAQSFHRRMDCVDDRRSSRGARRSCKGDFPNKDASLALEHNSLADHLDTPHVSSNDGRSLRSLIQRDRRSSSHPSIPIDPPQIHPRYTLVADVWLGEESGVSAVDRLDSTLAFGLGP